MLGLILTLGFEISENLKGKHENRGELKQMYLVRSQLAN